MVLDGWQWVREREVVLQLVCWQIEREQTTAPSPLLYPLNQANLQEWQGFLFRYSHTRGGGGYREGEVRGRVQEKIKQRKPYQYVGQLFFNKCLIIHVLSLRIINNQP